MCYHPKYLRVDVFSYKYFTEEIKDKLFDAKSRLKGH